MKFSYRGVTSDANLVNGEIEADDIKQAGSGLKKQHIQVLDLQEVRTIHFFSKKHVDSYNLSDENLNHFFEKLLRLLNGGLVLSEALETILRNTSDTKEKTLLENILREMQDGISFSKALNKFCNSLDTSMLSILDVGDTTGNLPHAVEDIVNILRRKIELKRHLISGLSYPIFICLMAFGVIGLFLFYLMPKIENMMYNLGGTLPLSARMLANAAHFVVHYFLLTLIVLLILWLFFKKFYRYPKTRLTIDRHMIQLPVLRVLSILYMRASVTHALATLLSNGIDLSTALNLAEKSINNRYVRQQYGLAQEAIMDGAVISDTLRKFGIIDGVAHDILSVGEKTGDLAAAFADVAAMYNDQLNKYLKKLVTSVSAVALLFAFALVAVLALSIVSSVLNFSNNIAH